MAKKPAGPAAPPPNLPTLYEYYTKDGVSSGLCTRETSFQLNGKTIVILSGAVHYFRVPQPYWRDRLRKARAAGLNTVETYVPWNLHEPTPGSYDFGAGGSDFEDFLDVEKFLKVAREEDLLVLVRPGPYICAEWEFGGLPSWLLRDKEMKIRTSDKLYMEHVTRYFGKLFAILAPLQFTKGGPIIGFQVENEYGNVAEEGRPLDMEYLKMLRNLMVSLGAVELLFTSDSSSCLAPVPNVLATVNFASSPNEELYALEEQQPSKPVMVMEFWTGWYDHWTEKRHVRSPKDFNDCYEKILKYPASVNLYMFHGGTSWGFMNGANIQESDGAYQPDISSYDYDAPLTEAGDYTDKYYGLQKLNEKYNVVKTKLPLMPILVPRTVYPELDVKEYLPIVDVINQAEHRIHQHYLSPMELLPINEGAGQSYGYVVYRKRNITIPANSYLQIFGSVCDCAMVLVNGELKSPILQTQKDLDDFGYWKAKNAKLYLGDHAVVTATLDIVVENMGRVNFGKLSRFGQEHQLKGLWQGDVAVNDVVLADWEIVPLEFKREWVNALQGWRPARCDYGPALHKGSFRMGRPTQDSFIYMGNWTKGVVIVNGFVVSRHCKFGPQQTVYLPAPLLRPGDNDIVIFEHFTPNAKITFTDNPVYANVV